jgi:hypothetical protein
VLRSESGKAQPNSGNMYPGHVTHAAGSPTWTAMVPGLPTGVELILHAIATTANDTAIASVNFACSS